jgi:hypothetical protein
MCDVLFCMTATPVINHFNNHIWNGEEGDCTRFLNHTSVDVKDLMNSLAVACGAEEYSRKCARAHCVCNCRVVVGLDV